MEFLQQPGGVYVRADAVALIERLRAAGHQVSLRDGVLVISNGSALSAEERATIKSMKWHLLHLAGADAAPLEPPLPDGTTHRQKAVGSNSAGRSPKSGKAAAARVVRPKATGLFDG